MCAGKPKVFLIIFVCFITVSLIFSSLVLAAPAPDAQEAHSYQVFEYQDLGILPLKRPEVDDAKEAQGLHIRTIPKDVLDGLTFPLNERTAVYAIKKHLRKNATADLSSLDISQLELASFHIIPATDTRKESFVAEFRQTFEGLKIDGTFVRVIGKNVDGRAVIRVETRVIPQIASYVLPGSALDKRELKIRAKEATGEQKDDIKEKESIRFIDGQWKKVYETSFNGRSVIVLDATTGHAIGAWESAEQVGVHGNVSGNGLLYQFSGGNQASGPINLRDLEVRLNNTHLRYTDTGGNFDFGVYISGFLEASMEGRWAEVFDRYGLFQSYGQSASNQDSTNITFNLVGNSSLVTVYHHTTIFRNQYKQEFPFLPGLNYKIPAYVNDDLNACGSCIAWFQSWNDSIHFKPNWARPLVAYHEYGHHMDHAAGGITNSPLTEGWAYLLSSFATGNPEASNGWYVSANWQWPTNGQGEEHVVGMVWAAFAWDLYESLGPTVAKNLMMQVLLYNSPNIPEAVIHTLVADDDDNDLTNGTPHSDAIIQAAVNTNLDQFINNNIPYLVAQITNVYGSPPGNILIEGFADAPAGNFLSYQLFYGLGENPAVWNAINEPSLEPGVDPWFGQPVQLGAWDVQNILPGMYTIKLVVRDVFLNERVVTTPFEVDPLPFNWVATGAPNQIRPQVSHNRIVWQDDTNGNQDIYFKDLNTGIIRQVTFSTADQIEPKISDKYIVWTDLRADASREKDLYAYNISTQEEIVVSMELGNQESPSISGNKVVWQDDRNGNWDIYWKSLPSSGGPVLLDRFQLSMECPINISTGATPPGCVAQAPMPEPGRLTNDSSDQTNPDISGSRIVWEDRRHGDLDIYYYDLTTHQEQRITTDAAEPRDPKIHGDIIVWTDYRNGNGDIYYYDLNLQQEVPLTADPTDETTPEVWGRWIVFHRNLGSTEGVYIYDIFLGTENVIELSGDASFDLFVREPAISGTKIVWNDNNDIWMYPMPIQPIPLTTDPSDQLLPEASVHTEEFSYIGYQDGNPEIYVTEPLSLITEQITDDNLLPLAHRIYGDYVIWVDSRNGNQDIFGYNRQTQQEFPVVVRPGTQNSPNVYGNKVVWQDDRNGNMDIYLYNIQTGQEVRITDDPFPQENPIIYGNKIVWEDSRHFAERSLYLCEYDDSSGTPTCPEHKITEDNGPDYGPIARTPYIWENKIVWQDLTDPFNGNVHMCEYNPNGNPSVCPNSVLVDHLANQSRPVIYDNLVMWIDDRHGNADIYLLSLDTNQERRVTTHPTHQGSPQFSGEWIIWDDNRNGDFNIYGVQMIEVLE